jgi:type VI secretion system protein ImpF
MTELSPKERLQPSLLDRLTDDTPSVATEPPEKRVLTQSKLREAVRRDLEWLFNAVNLACVQDLKAHPHVERSVLNYGIPDLTGRTSQSVDAGDLERAIHQVIADFEPRILGDTLKVTLRVDGDRMDRNAVTFEIEGDLYSEPLPVQIYLRTDVDLERGQVVVHEGGLRRGD